MEDVKIFKLNIFKVILYLLICLIFFILTYLMYLDTKSTISLLGMVFSGLGIVVFAMSLIPGSTFLKLDSEGIEWRVIYRGQKLKWEYIESFSTNNGGQIGFNTNSLFKKENPQKVNGMNTAKAINGYEGSLPNFFNMKISDTLNILNEWKKKYSN